MKIEEKLYDTIWNASGINKNHVVKPAIQKKVNETGTIRVDAVVKIIPQGERLLDIGCGDGTFCDLVRHRFKETFGVDISRKAVEISRQKGVHAKVVNINEENLPFPDDYFDCVTSLAFIEHIFEPEKLITEARRVLKKGGYFILNTPNIRYVKHLLSLIMKGRFPKTSGDVNFSYDGGHIHYFTLRDLTDLLEKNGFLVTIKFGAHSKEAEKHILYRLLSLFGRYFKNEFLSTEIFVIAKK